MPDHTIRLRGPWLLIDPEAPEGPPRRLALPATAAPEMPGPLLRLRRSFARPPRLAGPIACRLIVEDLPGLRAVVLNGRDLPLSPDVAEPTEPWDIGHWLRPRNLLELLVAPPIASESRGLWGSIALVFEPSEGSGAIDGAPRDGS